MGYLINSVINKLNKLPLRAHLFASFSLPVCRKRITEPKIYTAKLKDASI